MMGSPILFVGSTEMFDTLSRLAKSVQVEVDHRDGVSPQKVSELVNRYALIILENQGRDVHADPLLDRSDEGSALVYVLASRYRLKQAQEILLLRKRVIGYIDRTLLTDEKVRSELAQLMVEARERHGEKPGATDLPLGWAVGPLDTKDYEERRLVSLFIGAMREFIVGLKFLLSDLLLLWEVKKVKRPDSHIDLVSQLEDYHRWQVRGEEPRSDIEKKRREVFRKERKKYLLFPEEEGPVEPPTVILIRGESGTGKSLFARLIHHELRPGWPFREILCTGIPTTLLESELFGAMAGSYTDRKDTKPGRVLLAYGGVLFLDEIGDMPPVLQGKLLKFLDDSCIYPLGWVGDGIYVPVIIVAATNRDLDDLVRRKKFRPDLLYRLQQHEFSIAPLRERMWDLGRMVDFILQNPARNAAHVTHVRRDVLDRLRAHDFGGHFREIEGILFQAVQRARLKGTKILRAEHLPIGFRASESTDQGG